MPSTPNTSTFPAALRLRKTSDFDRVFGRRRSAADGLLIVYGCENGLPHPRLGLVVSRKVGGAVRRNRWKRLIREAFRLAQRELPAGLDLVVIPRGGRRPDRDAISASLRQLAGRIAARIERETS